MTNRGQGKLGDARGAIAVGLSTIALVFGGFGVWASTAPMAGAVLATGTIAAEAQRQAVQHPDGGTVLQIFVSNGDRVLEGEVLVRLDATGIRAEIDLLSGRKAALLAQSGRLLAERDGSDGIAPVEAEVPQTMRDAYTEMLAGQAAIFEARRNAHAGQVSALRQQIAQLQEQIGGRQDHRASIERQQELIREELSGLKGLFERGYTTKTRLLELERGLNVLQGQASELIAKAGEAREAIAEAEIRIEQLTRDRIQQITAESQTVFTELQQIAPKLAEAQFRLARTDLRAPRTGEIVDLQAFTVGGVIGAGDKVADIVPSDTPLIVEGSVLAADIENLEAGMPARVRLVAFRAPDVPVIQGTVTRVSADRVVADGKTTPDYSIAVALNHDPASRNAHALRVGMPVEVIVPTAERTMLAYLLAPLSNSMARAMRED